MKAKRVLIILILVVAIISCEKNPICPDEPNYHFFESDELKLLWENIDSALILQNKLRSGEIRQYDINSAYGKLETVQFINQSCNIVNYTSRYRLSPGHNQWCANEIPMIAQSSLYANDESFIDEIEITSEKAINNRLFHTINIVFNDGLDFKSNFTLSDSLRADYNVFNEEDNTTVIYIKAFKSDFLLENMNMEECLFFLFYDQNQTEKLKVIYSNKYGFLTIINNNKHELKRHFQNHSIINQY